jgi:hypothetical protein
LHEQLERLVSDTIFGEIQKQSGCFGSQSLATFGVFSEQFAQGQILDLFVMHSEGFPSRAFGEWFDRDFH